VLALLGACVVVTACAGRLAAAPTPAGGSDVATLRAQADEIADQYFRALARSRELDDSIARNEQAIADLEARATRARLDARARALIEYKSSASRFATLLDAKSTLDAARRAHLIDQVNARDSATFAKLRAAVDDLRAGRRDLQLARDQQDTVLQTLSDRARDLDAKLAQAQQAQQAEQAARASAAAASAVAAATTTVGAPTTAPAKPVAPPPPPNYQGTPGVNPNHDDPFLTCVRQREAGGNYGAVNPAGPYLGAYQFLQATWNGAANHAQRPDLVGVPANLATPYDQDDVAWSLYQWQGTRPWGACP
jgi:hypothetical protein